MHHHQLVLLVLEGGLDGSEEGLRGSEDAAEVEDLVLLFGWSWLIRRGIGFLLFCYRLAGRMFFGELECRLRLRGSVQNKLHQVQQILLQLFSCGINLRKDEMRHIEHLSSEDVINQVP